MHHPSKSRLRWTDWLDIMLCIGSAEYHQTFRRRGFITDLLKSTRFKTAMDG
jgi:hypothetical protein